jgi:hypothetical protein
MGALSLQKKLKANVDLSRDPKPKLKRSAPLLIRFADEEAHQQGCQIFLGTTYQNGKKYTKLTKIYQMGIKYIK